MGSNKRKIRFHGLKHTRGLKVYKIGLCSVTLRALTVEQVIEVATAAGLSGIEWGGDIHVPAGDIDRAIEVAELTKCVNLEVASYGSYYAVGYEENASSFEAVLETARKLTAPSIRVWAGKLGSMEADNQHRKLVVEEARRIATLAAEKNIEIHFEYHGGTLTDTEESAALFMKEINHPNVYLYWQPAVNRTVTGRLKSIGKIRPWLSNVHVFHWQETKRLPFAEGLADWTQYINHLKEDAKERYLFMEFVKGDSVEQLLVDVKALKVLLCRMK